MCIDTVIFIYKENRDIRKVSTCFRMKGVTQINHLGCQVFDEFILILTLLQLQLNQLCNIGHWIEPKSPSQASIGLICYRSIIPMLNLACAYAVFGLTTNTFDWKMFSWGITIARPQTILFWSCTVPADSPFLQMIWIILPYLDCRILWSYNPDS